MRGSITVFSTLCMAFVVSVLFFLLEAARVCGLERYAAWKGAQGAECAAAEYQPYLWEEFHLLMLDGAYGTEGFEIGSLTGHIASALEKNLDGASGTGIFDGLDFFQMDTQHIYEPEYLLATDGGGKVFLDMVAAYMEENLPREAAREIYERCSEQDEMEKNTADVDEAIENAKDCVDEAKEEAAEQEIEIPEEPEENPLEVVAEVKKSMRLSTLGLVIADTGTVSTKRIGIEDTLAKRTLASGNMEYTSEADWYRTILVMEYAEAYFSNYRNTKEGHALSYELEYLIGGKDEERDNLETVVNRLLLYRSAANITYLLSDSAKMAQAKAIATAIGGFTGNPAVIQAVQVAIVGAWAFLESVQDVRTLLDGGKIAIVKSKDQWTLDLGHLLQSFQKTSKAKNCENGLTYTDYLKQFLFFVNEKTLAFRMMDVMERNLGQCGEYQDCRMDHMIVSFRYEADLVAEPLFASMAWTKTKRLGTYSFRTGGEFCYIP